ncbi:uncharacterized protein LOC127843197 isoform X2 [Dreissena polymorpha]|uniref:uncharacterized protein LOC127843197 isoform X2 n=1 Tax=Dreissena polymorpha TaxID=45954 RepID=UPI002264919B|nr:uncharacterized protein LOC127843197 isoform X2 [Dreissena polymorpha]
MRIESMKYNRSDGVSSVSGGHVPTTYSQGGGDSPIQIQSQKQRSMEASKQMVYGVYGNVISIIEEHEKRESPNKRLAISDIQIPDQSRKGNDDIESIVETQLLLFETQLKTCPGEVRDQLGEELKQKTIKWCSVRHGQEHDKTDKFIAQLYEILARGRTQHAFHSRPRPNINAEVMRENIPHLMRGKHDQSTLDQSFQHDTSRKAVAPNVRAGAADSLQRGSERLAEIKPDLKGSLRGYMTQPSLL